MVIKTLLFSTNKQWHIICVIFFLLISFFYFNWTIRKEKVKNLHWASSSRIAWTKFNETKRNENNFAFHQPIRSDQRNKAKQKQGPQISAMFLLRIIYCFYYYYIIICVCIYVSISPFDRRLKLVKIGCIDYFKWQR